MIVCLDRCLFIQNYTWRQNPIIFQVQVATIKTYNFYWKQVKRLKQWFDWDWDEGSRAWQDFLLHFYFFMKMVVIFLQENIHTVTVIWNWDFSWLKDFVFMNCETYLALECFPKCPWSTAFEKSKIHQPNLEKLQFKGSKIEAFSLFLWKNSENRTKMLQSCCL